MATHRFVRVFLLGAVAVGMSTACSDRQPTLPAIRAAAGGGNGGVTVTATDPDSATQDTTLDVVVSGSGFDQGSQAQWAIAGVPSTKIRTNSMRFVTSKKLIANITIAIDADTGLYDVMVTASTGKKGIGSELFRVRPKGGVGNSAANPEIVYCCVAVANANGSNPSRVLERGDEPSWSPLGTGALTDPFQIVVHQGPGQQPGQLMVADVAIINGVPTTIATRSLSPMWAWSPAWSPLGDEIAYTEGSTVDPPSSLWVIPAADGLPAAVYHGEGDVRFATWSPDGRHLAFTEGTSTGPMIKIVDRASGASWVVIDSTLFQWIRYPDWARTKNAIAFGAYTGGASAHVYIVDLDANLRPIGPPRRVVRGASMPSWSPDDMRLVTEAGMHDVATGKRVSPAGFGVMPDWRR